MGAASVSRGDFQGGPQQTIGRWGNTPRFERIERGGRSLIGADGRMYPPPTAKPPKPPKPTAANDPPNVYLAIERTLGNSPAFMRSCVSVLDENEIDPVEFFAEHVPPDVLSVLDRCAGGDVRKRVLAMKPGDEFTVRLGGEGALEFCFRCLTPKQARARATKPRS